MIDINNAAQAFWSWFTKHKNDFASLTDTSDPFWDTALVQLQNIHSGLWFELSQPDGEDREFILTVEGNQQLFPLADAVITAAPKISGWRFISLKPAAGFDFKTTYEDVHLEPKSMWFLPLESEAHPKDLGVRIGVPGCKPAKKRQIDNGVLCILDTALGERVIARDIQHVETVALPENPQAEGYLELAQLPSYIEWRKNVFRQFPS